MKEGIHPEYKTSIVTCSCGNSFTTRSTVESIHVEICSHCHPFFTGRQKIVDTAGRVERFHRKYGRTEESGNGSEGAASEAEETREAGGTKASSGPEASSEVEPSSEVEASGEAEASGEEEEDQE